MAESQMPIVIESTQLWSVEELASAHDPGSHHPLPSGVTASSVKSSGKICRQHSGAPQYTYPSAAFGQRPGHTEINSDACGPHNIQVKKNEETLHKPRTAERKDVKPFTSRVTTVM